MLESVNLLGAVVAEAYYASCILLFTLRLLGKPRAGRWLGYTQTLVALPLVGYLLLKALQLERPALYTIQVSPMLVFLVAELLLDYVLKVDFRHTRWMVITYVMLFFAATGGSLGVVARAGSLWTISAAVLFVIMGALAFVQRRVTGM